MKFKYLVTTVLLFVSPFIILGKDVRNIYDYNENCGKAYQYYMCMNFQAAHTVLIDEINKNPYNLMVTYLSDYEDCLTLLLISDRDELEKRKGHLEERMQLLEKGSPSSPWYRLCRAGIYFHWAIISLRYGEEISAALKFRKACILLKENEELFPEFEYNKVYTGLQLAVTGSLPGNYKWLASILGFRGDVTTGVATLNHFLDTHNARQPLYEECMLYSLFTRFYLSAGQEDVWQQLTSPQYQPRNNPLRTFVKATIALDHRKSAVAWETISPYVAGRTSSPYPVFDYLAGVALLARCDTSAATYFTRYLHNTKSDQYIKDCWQKMSLLWYLNGEQQKADYCYQQIRKQGTARLDADKQAEKFGSGQPWPAKTLLKARLLTDGGYYQQAFLLLSGLNTNVLSSPQEAEEYQYRLGRIYQDMGNNSKAIDSYQNAINIGRGRHEQFAARAALQMGRVLEQNGLIPEAVRKYRECLAMPRHDCQNAIDHQAVAALNRISAK